jgi:hypothetical protein
MSAVRDRRPDLGPAARTQITGGLRGRVSVLIWVKPALRSRFSTSPAALRDVTCFRR